MIPRHIKFTSDRSQRDVGKIREQLRKNKIEHMNFNPVLESEEGDMYFKGIYQANQCSEEVSPETDLYEWMLQNKTLLD